MWNDSTDSPRIAIRFTGKPIGHLLVGNRAGLLELSTQLERNRSRNERRIE